MEKGMDAECLQGNLLNETHYESERKKWKLIEMIFRH